MATPRYFFKVHDGRDIQDDEGVELANFTKAKIEALRFTGDLLHNLQAVFWTGDQRSVEVTNETRQALFKVRV